MKDQNKLTLEQILDEFRFGSDNSDPETLRRLMSQYPEYADELAQFAALWAISEPIGDECLTEDGISEKHTLKVQSFALGALYDLDKTDSKCEENITCE